MGAVRICRQREDEALKFLNCYLFSSLSRGVYRGYATFIFTISTAIPASVCRALLKLHRNSLDMDELREYFALFNRPELLNELLG